MAVPAKAGAVISPPVVDGQGFLALDNAAMPIPTEVYQAIGTACRSWGTFQLTNHGLDAALLARVDAAMRAFFALPKPAKLACKRSEDNAYGYFDDEYTKRALDLKEGFDFASLPHSDLPDDHPTNATVCGHNRWPAGQPGFEATMKEWLAEMERCSYRLMAAFCLGLDLPAEALEPLFGRGHTSFCRLNYYPLSQSMGGSAASDDAVQQQWGISHHTDAGFLTVLLQGDVPGLEMEHGGAFHLVPCLPGSLTVNVGDMAQVLTNDLVKAPQHRVLASQGQERYSVPFFFNPRADAQIAPLPQLLAASDAAPAYRPFSWGQFRSQRFAGDYADTGEEIQISWYRTDRT